MKNANESTLPTKNNATMGNFGTGVLSPRRGSAHRVSLSPRPDLNMQLLPKGHVESSLNQNSIVIPGVSPAVVNTSVEAAQTMMMARIMSTSLLFQRRVMQ